MAALRRRPPRLATTSVLLAGALVVSSCSLGGDDPATVTLPELNTTTTTQPPGGPGGAAPRPDAEPLPVAWIAQVGGPGADALHALVGVQTSVVAVGRTDGVAGRTNAGGVDVLISRVGTDGQIETVTSAGSPGEDAAWGISSDESVVVCGSTNGQLGAAPAGGTDLWCATIDDSTAFEPTTQLGSPDDDRVAGVGTFPGSGATYVAGPTAGFFPGAQDSAGRGLGGGDAVVGQLDAAGRPVWARQFGTPVLDVATSVTANADGDAIAAGSTDGDLEGRSKGGRDAWLSRFDPSGAQRWITQIGSSGTDSIQAVTVTGEAVQGTELFLGAGVTDADIDAEGPAINAGLNDPFVAAVGSDGTLEWTSQFGSGFEETVGGVAADGQTIYVTGSTGDDWGDLLDDGGPGGARDGFLAALDAVTGEVLWVSRFGSAGDETMTGLSITEDGLLVASGITTGQMGEEPSAGGEDGFLIAFPLASAGGGAASSV